MIFFVCRNCMKCGKRNTVKVRSLWNLGFSVGGAAQWVCQGLGSSVCLGQGGIDRTCGCRCLSFWLPLGTLWMTEIGRQIEDETREMQTIDEIHYIYCLARILTMLASDRCWGGIC